MNLSKIIRSSSTRISPLGVLIVTSLAVRLALVFIALQHPDLPRSNDDYLRMATEWLSTGTYQETLFPPVYPAVNLLALVMSRGDEPTAILLLLLTQVILAVLTVLMVFDIARRVTGDVRVGLLAGVLFSFDPAVLIHGVMILSEVVYVFLVVAASWLVYRFSDRGDLTKSILLGFVLAIATLTRSVGVLAAGVVMLMLFEQLMVMKARVKYISITLCILLILMGSWGFRNYLSYGRFFLTMSGPYNFAVLMVGPAKARAEGVQPKATTDIWLRELAQSGLDKTDPVVQSGALVSIAFAWAKDNPGAMLKAVARNQARVWIGPGLASWKRLIPGFGVVTAVVLMFFRIAILVGTVAYFWKRDLVDIRVGALFLLMAVLHVASAGAAAYSRFLVPAIPFLSVLAAAGIIGFRAHLLDAFSFGSDFGRPQIERAV